MVNGLQGDKQSRLISALNECVVVGHYIVYIFETDRWQHSVTSLYSLKLIFKIYNHNLSLIPDFGGLFPESSFIFLIIMLLLHNYFCLNNDAKKLAKELTHIKIVNEFFVHFTSGFITKFMTWWVAK